jgi:hypothetical protein
MQLAHPVVAVVQIKVVASPQQLMQLLQAVAAELFSLVAQVELQITVQLRAAHYLAEPGVQLMDQKAALAAAAVILVAAAAHIKLQLRASMAVVVVARGI